MRKTLGLLLLLMIVLNPTKIVAETVSLADAEKQLQQIKSQSDQLLEHWNQRSINSLAFQANLREEGQFSIEGFIEFESAFSYDSVEVEVYQIFTEYDNLLGRVKTVLVDENGYFGAGCLSSGLYKVQVVYTGDRNYPSRWLGNTYSEDDATVITLEEPQEEGVDLDIYMAEGGFLSGSITLEDSDEFTVSVYDASTHMLIGSQALVPDSYTEPFFFNQLYPGDFKVQVRSDNHDTEWYGGGSNFESATAISVSQYDTTSGIHLDLELSDNTPLISGNVMTADEVPLAYSAVMMINANWGTEEVQSVLTYAMTDANGDYTISGIEDGTYYLFVPQPYGTELQPQIYEQAGTQEDATPVIVQNQLPVNGVDFVLSEAGTRITGNISGSESWYSFVSMRKPMTYDFSNLVGYFIDALFSSYSSQTDINGNYHITGAWPGEYQISIRDSLYSEVFAPGTYNQTDADIIIITEADTLISDVDITVPDGVYGTVSGEIIFSGSPDSIPDIGLLFYSSASEQSYLGGSMQAPGYYSVSMPAGEYKLNASYSGYDNYPTMVWSGGASNYSDASVVEVQGGQTTTNIDFLFEACPMLYMDPVRSADELPLKSELLPCYPNPFNPETHIQFVLASDSEVALNIFDLKGRCIWQHEVHELPAGSYSVVWNGTDHKGQSLPSGIYLISLQSGHTQSMQKVMLLK